MQDYIRPVEIRWADLDPNFHLRHSAYYDFGAYSRICFLTDAGFTPAVMMHHHIGPVLFREECSFRKEIHFGDDISIDLQLDKSNSNFSRWIMKHQIFKNTTILCATIIIEGAWIDTKLRKLTVPDILFAKAIDSMPKTESFAFSEKK